MIMSLYIILIKEEKHFLLKILNKDYFIIKKPKIKFF